MTHNEKLDYLLAIINQNPEKLYDDIYKKVDIPISWDEYIRLIKELLSNKCLEHDHYVGVSITERGRYKLNHSFSKEEKAGQKINKLEAKEMELSENNSEWHLGHSILNMYNAFLNKVSMQISKYLPREKG